MTNTYSIGDVHGEIRKLKAALDFIRNDAAQEPEPYKIVFHGDYVDRGEDTKAVLDLLMAGSPDPTREHWYTLQGNHDQLMHLSMFNNPFAIQTWMKHGGQMTLKSFGISPYEPDAWRQIPFRYADFLRSLPVMHTDEHRIYVHAGLDPKKSFADQDEEDIMWIRAEFLNEPKNWGKPVIYGHNPTEEPENLWPIRVGIDTGACFDSELMGKLTVAKFVDGGPPEFNFFR